MDRNKFLDDKRQLFDKLDRQINAFYQLHSQLLTNRQSIRLQMIAFLQDDAERGYAQRKK